MCSLLLSKDPDLSSSCLFGFPGGVAREERRGESAGVRKGGGGKEKQRDRNRKRDGYRRAEERRAKKRKVEKRRKERRKAK